MEPITIRPDMRTAGGETNDLMIDGRYVGSMTLVYREQGRLTGIISLDRSALPAELNASVVKFAKDYIQSLLDAYEAIDCDVMVTSGIVEEVIATEMEENDTVDVMEIEGEDALEVTDDEMSAVLTRDDGDVLTYELYCQSMGGLPIATATVDLSRMQLSGYVDLHRLLDENDREQVALKLMQELDKEKEYEVFNVTMMHNNEWIDEMLFEQDALH